MARGNFGELLKRERELREVTPEEIASATRIGSRFLQALENEDWDKLPGGIFNRGFVRSIARYLGLDEEDLLAEYDLAHGATVPAPVEKPGERIPSPPRWIPVALLLGALLIVVGLIYAGIYGWRYYRSRHPRNAPAVSIPQPSAPSSFSASSDPAVPPTALLPTAAPLPPLELAVSSSAPTHLRVLSDGVLLFDNNIRPGENHHFAATDNFEVSAADSGAVLLELNGQAVPPLGLPGSSGTMKLNRNDLRQANSGSTLP
jgi:helix-turn-helix protein/uncharacterized protein DUF4115